jgi:broad specificity polyphosphatase/5'/3'-nucleotidase SurE
MKTISFAMCALVLCVSAIALSQSETHKPDGQEPDAQQTAAQLAFARLKTLAGNWKGRAARVVARHFRWRRAHARDGAGRKIQRPEQW